MPEIALGSRIPYRWSRESRHDAGPPGLFPRKPAPKTMPDHSALPTAFRTGCTRSRQPVSTLRRGMPAIVGTAARLAVLAVETADEAGARGAQQRRMTPDRPRSCCCHRPGRPSSCFRRSGVGRWAGGVGRTAGLDMAGLRALADPTFPQTGPCSPASGQSCPPKGSEAALALAVLARLLPALLVVSGAWTGLAWRRADILDHAALERQRTRAGQRGGSAAGGCRRRPARGLPRRADGAEQYAVLIGRPELADAPLVRVHSECFTGDLLGSLQVRLRGAVARCHPPDRGRGGGRRAVPGAGGSRHRAAEQAARLHAAGSRTGHAGRQPGARVRRRRAGFPDRGGHAAAVGLRRIRLLTNNPDKIASLAAHGIEVVGRASLLFAANGVNDRYLQTKADRLGHLPALTRHGACLVRIHPAPRRPSWSSPLPARPSLPIAPPRLTIFDTGSEQCPQGQLPGALEFTPEEARNALNPLQYVPVVGMIYRQATGETIPPPMIIAGSVVTGAIFGGPIGILGSVLLNAAVELARLGPDTSRPPVPEGFDVTGSEAGVRSVSPGSGRQAGGYMSPWPRSSPTSWAAARTGRRGWCRRSARPSRPMKPVP